MTHSVQHIAASWAVSLRHLVLAAALAGMFPLALQAAPAPAPAVTTATLLEDMTNLAGLATWPSPAYTCRQFSSYDPKSVRPGNDDWFANADVGQYLRKEAHAGREEFVMMDVAGPGAVVRIWSANPDGTLRIYLDGSKAPVIETTMNKLLGGRHPGLPKPLAGERSKGWNLNFPIPYARHCKITSDKGGFYYHVNYRTYPAGTAVETFRPDMLETLAPAIAQVARQLDQPRNSGAGLKSIQLTLAPGQSARKTFRGSQAITRLVLQAGAVHREAALRSVILKISFDGQTCVEAPLGDFFGTGPGVNPFASLPLGMTKDGEMYSQWFMPFRKSAVLEWVNLGAETVTVTGGLALARHRWTESSLHFHARWRTQFRVPTRPMIDWNYLDARGHGLFAGAAFTIDNPVKEWWGEGDEKIYVDGESFPSHFGTGTEDYFSYAWCWPGLFTHAYHAQPRCDGPGNFGRTSVNRFHILDRIPFQSSFKFDMELWHWHAKTNVNMAVTAYWYARPGGTDTFPPIRPADTIVQPLPEYTVFRVPGALEAEKLPITRVQGQTSPQDWDGLSNGTHLWWQGGMKPGDTLALGFAAPKAGRYRVFARFLSAKDYGIHRLAINGRPAGEPRDFYHDGVALTPEMDLGVFDLTAGDNEFAATVVGANPKAIPTYMLGLDYLRLEPAN